MRTEISKILLAIFAVCVLASATQAEAKGGSKNKSERSSRDSERLADSRSERSGKIKACEAAPTKYWDYFSKRCLPIPK